jgi:hypothetical protein
MINKFAFFIIFAILLGLRLKHDLPILFGH